ncbi:hypothetical protein [Oceanobacillus sp. FSL W7-1293]|uniref:hypothetical protein n=1 Tax=Oceanobacillus TaxID=182709 RepID=UPI0030CF1204
MVVILTVAPNDIFIGTLVYLIMFVYYFLAFAILSAFLINDKKKANVFIALITIGFFYSFTNLLQTSIIFAMASLATCIFFIIVLSVWYRKRNKQ